MPRASEASRSRHGVIEHYTDHSANERTFLAWIRTAIAVAAFGFLVEKFDLFLNLASRSSGGPPPSRFGALVAEITGLLLIALGGTMMGLAAIRFRRTGAQIDSPDRRPATGAGMDLGLVAILMLFGAVLLGYLVVSVVSHLP